MILKADVAGAVKQDVIVELFDPGQNSTIASTINSINNSSGSLEHTIGALVIFDLTRRETFEQV